MSKFSKALEQAQRERALRMKPGPPKNLPLEEPPPAPAPRVAPPPSPTAPVSAGNGSSVVKPPRPASPPGGESTREIRDAASGKDPAATSRRSSVPGSREVDPHLVSLVSPSGLEAEQYRALRHVVEQRHKFQNLTVLAVSSPGVGDGKTTTSINLAGALAQGPEARVLLVEADLRRPCMGRLLGISDTGQRGLVHAIFDRDLSLPDIVISRSPYNLNVVLAGQVPPSPYELLKSPRLGELLDQARQQYDFIIIDTPPLAPVQDSRIIARWVDGFVLVVAAHHTPRALFDAALDVLEPSRLIGIVFNGYDHLLSGRYTNHYAAYYAPRAAGPGLSGMARATRGLRSLLRGHKGDVRSRRGRDRTR